MGEIPRVAGYEYDYDFSIKEELVSLYNHKLRPGHTNLIFEIKTSFILKTINGQDEILDSEVINTVLEDGNGRTGFLPLDLNLALTRRLEDYWMAFDEINRFENEAVDFALWTAKAADPPRRVVPVFVDLKVRTVQLDGEPVGAAMERALRAENLVPFFDNPFEDDLEEFVECLKKNRVGDNDGGLAMMRICDICSRGPFIGCQISRVRACGHAFHSHCYARWLMEGNTLCPSCRSLAYGPDWIDDDE